MRRTCLVFLTITLLCGNTAAQNNVGKIVKLKGTALLKQVDGKIITLTEENFVRGLQPNQKLRLNRNGQMEVWLCNDKSLTIPSDKWYPIPPTIICSAPADSPLQRVMNETFDPGARHRGKYSFILFPIVSKDVIDIVRPETAVLRLVPAAIKVDLSISVIGVEHAPWVMNDVSDENGSFTDDSLKKFLEDVREKHPDAQLRMKVHTSSNTGNSTIFRLLSKEQEEALQKELANLKYTNRVLSHLFRAEVYLRYMLFNEAADEYEKALKLAPESIELLRATVAVEEMAGNLKRRDELEHSIETLGESIR